MDYTAILITLKLALTSTFFLLVLCIPLGWWLSLRPSFLRNIIGTFVSMPLVLPPTVLGFYLLILLGPQGFIGKMTTALGIGPLTFTFSGLVIGSIIFSLPFVLGPIQSTFQSFDKNLIFQSYALGAGRWQTFTKVILPNTKHGIIYAAILGLAHTIGEFGVVLMIGGNIPGETRVLSVSIYDHVESLDYKTAHSLSLGLLLFSFFALWPLYRKRTVTGGLDGRV